MTTDRRSIREFTRHLTMGILVNSIAILLLVNAYFAETTASQLAAGIRIVLAFWALTFARDWIKRLWPSVRHPLYYFLPVTVIFWILNKRPHKPNVKTGTARVQEIIATWPDASIGVITGIVEPQRQEETLTALLGQMDTMKDCYLATITDRIRRYLGDILESVRTEGNYHLFRQVMLRLSSYEPARYRATYKRFFLLLSDVFDPSLAAKFGTRFQRHMVDPLKHALEQADKAHAGRVRDIIAKIMADGANEHEIASSVAEILLQLDWNDKREICHIIFDESLKRAFRFPRLFGIDFLRIQGF